MSLNILEGYGEILRECAIALLPLVVIILAYQIFFLKLENNKIINCLKGIIITFIGLTLFLQGVNIGYIPFGREIGKEIAKLSYNWILIPIGFLFGYAATMAEPSVKVLVGEIERVTGGYINKKIMMITLCTGVGIALSIAMIKLLYRIPLWYFIVPGYIIAIILSCFTSERFTAIAFDSGGVATGTMAVTFLLSMAIGVSESIEGLNPATDGFGVISLIALIPILMVLILGLIYEREKR